MSETLIKSLFEAGAHYGYRRGKRHPSSVPYIFCSKDRNDILDLEKTAVKLTEAQEFISAIAKSGKQVLFVGGKTEIAKIVREGADRVAQPYVTARWIGGTLTNHKEMRKRIDRLERLRRDRDSGDRDKKYTKLERLMQDREITDLEAKFGGVVEMRELPAALFVVDPRYEITAVREATQLNIPIVALANTDCDFGTITMPIPANDTARKSVTLIVGEIAKAYTEGKNAIVS